MAHYSNDISRTFSEYLLIPSLTTKDCVPHKVDLSTPLVKFKQGEKPTISLNIPLVSAIMQSVSHDGMAISLARNGGLSFIYGSQSIEDQCEMISKVKKYKAGFVISDANLTKEHTLQDVMNLKRETGHSTIGVTHDGTSHGKLIGIVSGRDYRPSKDDPSKKVADFMTPFEKIVTGDFGITLPEANDIIWKHKLNVLPIIDDKQHLKYFVFRKDYESHKEHPFELSDEDKRLYVGAGINTRDYAERVPALVAAGADVLCIDSSDGYSVWQKETIEYIKEHFPHIPVGAGNIVDKAGFDYLVAAGADFIKVGIGGGSICITREQKGIGRGQATALIEVNEARQAHYEATGEYVPLCSDGGIAQDYHMVLALAMGADFMMMGRYFARFDESPTRKILVNGNYMKEYWGEGSARARNWQRYDMGSKNDGLKFEEGVDSFVPYAGKLKDNLNITLGKIKATMCSCGAISIPELMQRAKITLVSATSIVEGGAHDVLVRDNNTNG